MISDRKILFVSPFEHWPLFHGSIVRSHYFVKYLSRENSLWFVYRQSDGESFQENNVIYIPNTSRKLFQLFNLKIFIKLFQLIKKEKINLIIASHFFSSIICAALKASTGIDLIIDNHNIEYLRFQRNHNPLWMVIKIIEYCNCKIADKIICVSDFDKSIIENQFNIQDREIQVLPNGVDIESTRNRTSLVSQVRKQLQIDEGENILLFFGDLQNIPNKNAVHIILTKLIPILVSINVKFKIVIAGRGGLEYQETLENTSPNLIFTGFVKDLSNIIMAADCVIVPLTSGSGTRLKILESLSLGKQVISTSIGAEGIEVDGFKNILWIEDDWIEFCNRIMEITLSETNTDAQNYLSSEWDWKYIVSQIQCS